MTLRYEDFNLYYQHTYMMVEDKLSFIHGVMNADSPASYTVGISPLVDGEHGPRKEYPSRGLLQKFKPFVPSYGYINYGDFAVLAVLGAYRMARKAFSLDRVEFVVPNDFEFTKFLALRHSNREAWFSLPVLVAWLDNPCHVDFDAAVTGLYSGESAGRALSQDFALCSMATKSELALFYKNMEIGQVNKEGEVSFTKPDTEPLQALFTEQVKRKQANE